MKVLTEAELRTANISRNLGEYHVPEGTFVTPMAKEYMRDHHIRLVIGNETVGKTTASSHASMTRTPIKPQGGYTYVDAATGEGIADKPEDMTHLRGNILVPKTHPRIALRGKLDSLQAEVLMMEARYSGQKMFCRDLDSVLCYLRSILGAEVKEEKLEEILLFGLNHKELRHMSHDVKGTFGMEHPIPDSTMDIEALEVNFLRTQVREAELTAVNAFCDGDFLRIIEHLNRLSSGIYILFCRIISGYYKKMEGEQNE